MSEISRRDFSTIATNVAAAGSLSASASNLLDSPLGMPIGCQTYPVRKMIAEDFIGTLKQLSDAGFQAIELCSPVGYADSGFAGLAKYKPSELKKILSDINLQCESCHFDIKELRTDLPGRIEWAKDLGFTQMLVPTLAGPHNPTMDDVKRVASAFNKMAEQSAMAGIPLGLHNETFELSKVDGKRTYDVLFELLDPKLVKFQFQVSTISRGYEAAEYFMNYPGRFISMHTQGWSAKTEEITPIGQDTLDWKRIFATSKTGGIRNYFVEMDLEKMRASVPYLRTLGV
jgi:sugar phosphate isomerase/epimerase